MFPNDFIEELIKSSYDLKSIEEVPSMSLVGEPSIRIFKKESDQTSERPLKIPKGDFVDPSKLKRWLKELTQARISKTENPPQSNEGKSSQSKRKIGF